MSPQIITTLSPLIGYYYTILFFSFLFFPSLFVNIRMRKSLTFVFIVKLMFEECQGDKFEFMKRVKSMAQETQLRVA